MRAFLFIILIAIYFFPIESARVELINALSYVWLIGMLFCFLYIYYYKDKEYTPKFKDKYLNSIPIVRTPTDLAFLLYNNIKVGDLISTLMVLIYKDIFKVKKYKNSNDLVFVYNKDHNKPLTRLEGMLVKWFIKRIGDGERVTLNAIEKEAKKNSSYFLSYYKEWLESAHFEVTSKQFYESKRIILDEGLSYFGLSVILIIVNIVAGNNPIMISIIISCIAILILYIYYFNRRTENANEEYYKWLAFKRYIGSKDAFDKEHNVDLLEQYAIYSAVLNENINYQSIIIDKLKKNTSLSENSVLLTLIGKGVWNEVDRIVRKSVSTAIMRGSTFAKGVYIATLSKHYDNKEEKGAEENDR